MVAIKNKFHLKKCEETTNKKIIIFGIDLILSLSKQMLEPFWAQNLTIFEISICIFSKFTLIREKERKNGRSSSVILQPVHVVEGIFRFLPFHSLFFIVNFCHRLATQAEVQSYYHFQFRINFPIMPLGKFSASSTQVLQTSVGLKCRMSFSRNYSGIKKQKKVENVMRKICWCSYYQISILILLFFKFPLLVETSDTSEIRFSISPFAHETSWAPCFVN